MCKLIGLNDFAGLSLHYVFKTRTYKQGEADKVLQKVCDKMTQIQENFLCVFCYWCHGLLKCNFFLGRHGSA